MRVCKEWTHRGMVVSHLGIEVEELGLVQTAFSGDITGLLRL